MSDRLLRFIGSIQLAVPLLGLITGILIFATFYEAQVGSIVVQQDIYKSPWFGGLMFLLALNLGVSALFRYPWRGARKIGFALTHLGLIVIIAGSAAVIHLGLEGMLLLHTDGGSNHQIRVEGELLEVMSPEGDLQQNNLFVKPDGSLRPDRVAGLSLLGYAENTIKTVSFSEGATVENPAVRLSLSSDRMGQTLERWLAAAPTSYRQMPIGPAELEIEVVTAQELASRLSPPEEENRSLWGTLHLTSETGEKFDLNVEKNRSQTVELGDRLQLKILNFWPDFRLDASNQPTTASPQLNNPAVQLELTSPTGVERWFTFGRSEFAPVRSLVSGEEIEGVEIAYDVKPQTSENYFHVIATPDGNLFYTARSSKGFKSGELHLGEPISPGWADFQITLEEFVPHAQLNRQILPVSDGTFEGIPALLVETESGTQAWLPWGEPTTISESDGDWLAAFSPKAIQLPFSVALEEFIVDRNEGSDSVAMWTSKIRLEDPHNGVISRRNVWMNHPTWYKGWKIAQASWNPGDLTQSTLQVKREPAWVTALTWTGSALLVGGIGVMFYGGAIVQKLSRLRPNTEAIEESHPQSAAEYS